MGFWCPMPLGCDHFLLGGRQCVKEGLHRRLAEAPASLMWPRLIVFAKPQIKIGLQLVDRTIHLFAEGDAVELVEHGLVEALADAVGLRALGLGPRMVDVLDGKIELVLVMLWIAAIFRAPTCERKKCCIVKVEMMITASSTEIGRAS